MQSYIKLLSGLPALIFVVLVLTALEGAVELEVIFSLCFCAFAMQI